MKTLSFFKITFLFLLLSSCSTFDMPVKTVRDTSIITGDTPKAPNTPDYEYSTPADSEQTQQPAAAKNDNTSAPPAAPATPSSSTPVAATPLAPAVEHKDKIELTQLEMQKFAYELGMDPKKPLSEEQKKQILDRKKLRELERSLDSQKERVQYSKVLPWFKTDLEKIEMLSIPSVEGRQVWINKNKIWSRAKNLREYDDVVESADIAVGMPAEYVKKSWGEPDGVETSGNPIYRNERWQYNKQVSTPQGYKQEKRFVYFEGGRVVGWETE